MAPATGWPDAGDLAQLDPMNPQVAARLAGERSRTWRRYDKARQEMMRAELEAILKLPGISPNLFEVAGKILH